jgi:phosphohistidine phosphatase
MSQTLYLLRHAKAELWSPDSSDFVRRLSSRGRKHMDALSAWAFKELHLPECCLCSSSARTRETIEPFYAQWTALEQSTVYMNEIYEASSGTLHSLAEAAFETSDSVMMVGHNPGFEYLAMALLRDSDANGITKMATGTLAVIEFSGTYQQDSGQGLLRNWVTRKNFSGN